MQHLYGLAEYLNKDAKPSKSNQTPPLIEKK